MAQKLFGKALVVADADRVAAARWARERLGATVFVLDDAFQHRRARRDLDIVCIDATIPFGSGRIFLREPLKNLRRAGGVVITRANLVEKETISNLRSQIKKFNPDCPIFTAENKITKLIELKEFNLSPPPEDNSTDHRPPTTDGFLAFCALGNPDNFFEQLKRENFAVSAVEKFPDHHFYTQRDIAKLEEKARLASAKILVTTAKDAVKLKDINFSLPVFVTETQLIFDDEKKLRDLIGAVFNRKSEI